MHHTELIATIAVGLTAALAGALLSILLNPLLFRLGDAAIARRERLRGGEPAAVGAGLPSG